MPSLKARLPRGRRIGLLGGSFNPAHQGHLHISRAALKRLRLDEVWWLVSPQNPLKSARGMGPLAKRAADARRIARHPRIRVSTVESELGTVYTADTLRRLTRRFPEIRFVWLMGADNLAQIHRWRDWADVFAAMPVAVFARPTYSLRALASVAARQFARVRVPEAAAGALADRRPPSWAFLHIPLSFASATAIRAGLGRGRPQKTKPRTKRTTKPRKERSRPSRDGRKPKRHRRA
ncbi:MAG: nicotinate-nucleotide adenylyltransferase [Alphaproteobacteria bacterium]|nr:nicotinate-nucleotide adenylyltransferase [Alphaproteobacteria bacterium]